LQTFLPYPDFARSAACLDNKRLGKQRVECLQILKALSDPTYSWQNHPAVRMWRGSEHALRVYGQEICNEWTKRGFQDTCSDKLFALDTANWLAATPKWLGDDAFHASHRSNLLRKLPSHYKQFGWTEPDNLSYIWPVK